MTAEPTDSSHLAAAASGTPPRSGAHVRGLWRPVTAEPGHALAALEGAEVGQGVRLSVELGPQSKVGSDYFRAFLVSDDLGLTTTPVVSGLINRGPYPGYNWVEVADSARRLVVAEGGEVDVPEAIELRIVMALGTLVPEGGHLMIEYDSPHRATTARALMQNVPPVATPLGAMMFAAGCGVAFTDWYIAEGGREGPRKLQGFRALDEAHEERRGAEMLRSLEAFMARSREVDWDVQMAVRPLAEATITVLRERLGVPPGPLDLS